MNVPACPVPTCRADAVHFHYLDDDGPGVECRVGVHEYHRATRTFTCCYQPAQPTTRTMEVSQ